MRRIPSHHTTRTVLLHTRITGKQNNTVTQVNRDSSNFSIRTPFLFRKQGQSGLEPAESVLLKIFLSQLQTRQELGGIRPGLAENLLTGRSHGGIFKAVLDHNYRHALGRDWLYRPLGLAPVV